MAPTTITIAPHTAPMPISAFEPELRPDGHSELVEQLVIEDCGVSVTVVTEAAVLNILELAGVELMENEELDNKDVADEDVVELTAAINLSGGNFWNV